jgi:ribonuclease T
MIRYLSVDVEASGLVPGHYNLLSIGATKIVESADRFEPGESFYAELKPIFPGFDPDAMKIHGLDAERLKASGEDPVGAMRRFAQFAESMRADPADLVVFVGNNAAFDWAFVTHYFQTCGVQNPFHYAPLDLKSLAAGLFGVAWDRTKANDMAQRAGVPYRDPARAHNAAYDAEYQADLFCAMMMLQRSRSR